MRKIAGYILAAMSPLAWGGQEVTSYAEGLERVKEDGWVLLCHSADWDETHNEQWMRRQSSITSACGNALVLYVPIYQNPSPAQEAAAEQLMAGSTVNLQHLHSVPCALLLDQDGQLYATISGDEFMEHAAGKIRQAQVQLRARNNLLREADQQEGAARAQVLSNTWRLGIRVPENLRERMQEADPNDSAGISEWSPFDPWALARRIRSMPWDEAAAELDRVQQAPLSKEEQQAVLAIRISCVHHHFGVAGAAEVRRLANACTALAPGTALGKAAARAGNLWGAQLNLSTGWQSGQLPRVAAECEIAGTRALTRNGEYRICFIPEKGQDPLRITRVTLYDGNTKVSEDIHTCSLKAGEELVDNEYMLILHRAPARPRLVVTFDQQGAIDTQGSFALRYFNEDGIEEIKVDAGKAAADEARRQISERNYPVTAEGEAAGQPDANTPAPTTEP